MKHLIPASAIPIRKIINVAAAALKKVPWLLAQHAFLTILACLAVELLIGELLFYKYAASVNIQEPLALQSPVVFKEAAYQAVVKEWQERQAASSTNGQENISNPFQTTLQR